VSDPDEIAATRRAQRPVHPLTIDPQNMLGAVRELPTQLSTGWERARRFRLPDAYRHPKGVAIVGMGGSAIAADLIGAIASRRLTVPLVVVRDYALPAWVGPETLVIGSSFSGNTEETLAAWDAARARGALRLAITSGGALLERARAEGTPIVPLPGRGQPRAALGHSVTRILGVLWAAGLVDDPGPSLATATTLMRALVASAGEGTDPAVSPSALAERLVGRIPLIWASDDMAPVAGRWRAQLNENAKVFAASASIPEASHNAIEGFGAPAEALALLYVIVLTGDAVDERIERRIAAMVGLLDRAGIARTVLRAPGGGRLAESLWLVQYGDLVSVYLAYRYGIDPSAIPAIERLKADLAGRADATM